MQGRPEADQEQAGILSEPELAHLENLILQFPQQLRFAPGRLRRRELKHVVLKLENQKYVVRGKRIGKGFWGEVFLSYKYNCTPQGKLAYEGLCVVKKLRDANGFRSWLYSAMAIKTKMKQESQLNQDLNGEGSYLEVGKDCYIIMRYLAKQSLDKLIENTELASQIPCREWLRCFRILFNRLEHIHIATNCLHKDIKPENIGVTIQLTNTGLVFSEVSFFDLGIAHKVNETGSFGDPNFQPLESVTVGWFIANVNNSKVDISALGKSLLNVINTIKFFGSCSRADCAAYEECENLFKDMCAFLPENRPELELAKASLMDIIHRYEALPIVNAAPVILPPPPVVNADASVASEMNAISHALQAEGDLQLVFSEDNLNDADDIAALRRAANHPR